MNRTKFTLILIIVVTTIITCINPIYPHEQFLQHAGTVLLLTPLLLDTWKNRIPMPAFVGLVLFTLLHVIGARYIYSYVPYKDWCTALGIVDADFFQDPRNHYDRLVHFSFVLCYFPISFTFVRICSSKSL